MSTSAAQQPQPKDSNSEGRDPLKWHFNTLPAAIKLTLNMNNTLFMDRFTVYEMIIINSIHKTKNGPFLLIIHIFRQSIIFQCPYLHRYKDSIHFPLSAHEHFMQYRKHGASNGTQHLHFHQAKYLGFTILKEPMIFAHI
jgi:hypothetical protein